MVRKYFTGRRSGGMREVPVSRGFLGNFRKRFTLAFGEPITIAATGTTGRTLATASRRTRSHVWRAVNSERNVWDLGKAAGQSATGLERGRRRTRQDQISQAIGQLDRWTQEIANRCGIRTERRKPVSSAGPAFGGRELPQITIQPFDLMSRRHPLSST
jgi:hypothetical protein